MSSSIQTSLNIASCDGIGIVEFFQGKNFLITGATGFLAKIFVEKMLRTMPSVGRIFLLMKAKDKKEAMHRLESEIINAELFKYLKEDHGKSYRTFMMSKLVPVPGNICHPNLGMDDDFATEIAKEVNVIVNSAANTTWDERYDVALYTNTGGPYRLLSFAKKCKKLNLFLHVSTAYVNGERQGIILEKPFCMGDSIASERIALESQPISLPALDIDAEMKLASDLMEAVQENEVTQKMKELGLKRARMYGWQNVYVFTKAMGEMLINSMRGDIPVVIIRPSIIESTSTEPFPGWIEGYRMLEPIILLYAKGQLPGFVLGPKTVTDIIPADMVVNTTMAAMAKHGNAGKPELSIYHVTSSAVNPIVFQDVMELCREYFTASPLMDSQGKRISLTGIKFCKSVDSFSSYVWNEMVGKSRLTAAGIPDQKFSTRLEMERQKVVNSAIHLAKIYDPYALFQGRFDNGNTQKLMEDMSEEELKKFRFDVGRIDWKDYFLNVHLPGLRRNVIKEKLISTI